MPKRSSKAANLEFPPVYGDFNQVGLIDNRNMVETNQQSVTGTRASEGSAHQEIRSLSGRNPVRRNQPNSKQKRPVSDLNNELLQPPPVNSAPNAGEASHAQKRQTAGVKHRSGSARDDRLQPCQVNTIDNFGRRLANVSHKNQNPLQEQGKMVSSPTDSTSESLHDRGESSNPRPLPRPANLRIEGSDSSHDDADAKDADAEQTRSSSYSPLIMEKTHPFPMALAEKLPQNGSYAAQSSFHSDEATSAEAKQTRGQVGSSNQVELPGPQPLESLNRDKAVMSSDQFEQNAIGKNNIHDYQQALAYPNLFSQNSNGRGFWNGGSAEINQQLPSWLSNTRNDLYRPVDPSGSSEVNPLKAAGSSGPQCYNFMLPGTSTPLRPTPLNNPLLQLLNQDPNYMPSATDSVLRQQSVLPRNPLLPVQQMLQHSYQHDQVQPGAYGSKTNFDTILPESSLPLTLRTPVLHPDHYQMNPLDASDLHYRSSVQPKSTMPSSGGFIFQDPSNHHQGLQLNPAAPKLLTSQLNNSMLHESPLYSGSQQFPAHLQASNLFSLNPGLPNYPENRSSELLENPLLPGVQSTVEQQGIKNQTARPTPRYARSGNVLTTLVFNSLLEADKNGGAIPFHIDPSALTLSCQEEVQPGSSCRQQGQSRSRFEVGESSSFKRFRRECNRPEATPTTAEQVIDTSLSLQNNEATTSEVMANLEPDPRAIKNSLYDPIFEGIGLPIDPHLRLFARYH